MTCKLNCTEFGGIKLNGQIRPLKIVKSNYGEFVTFIQTGIPQKPFSLVGGKFNNTQNCQPALARKRDTRDSLFRAISQLCRFLSSVIINYYNIIDI